MTTQRHPLSYYLALEYPFTVAPDDGSYFIEFPDLPGCMTQVEDPAEIAAMAEEIRTLWIEGEYADGATIPEPLTKEYSGKFVLRMPKSLHRDLAEAAEREGVSLNAYVAYLLAERRAFDAVRPAPSSPQLATREPVQKMSAQSSGSIRPQLTVVRQLTRVS